MSQTQRSRAIPTARPARNCITDEASVPRGYELAGQLVAGVVVIDLSEAVDDLDRVPGSARGTLSAWSFVAPGDDLTVEVNIGGALLVEYPVVRAIADAAIHADCVTVRGWRADAVARLVRDLQSAIVDARAVREAAASAGAR